MLNARMCVHGWLGLRLGGRMWLLETRLLLDCQSDNRHLNSLPTVYERLFLETEQKPTDLGQESKPQTRCAPKPSIALYLTNSNSPLALAVTLTSPPLTLRGHWVTCRGWQTDRDGQNEHTVSEWSQHISVPVSVTCSDTWNHSDCFSLTELFKEQPVVTQH